MNVLIAGGLSSVAQAVIPSLRQYAQVTTAGRRQCDIVIDLAADQLRLPSSLDTVLHTAAHFGGKSLKDFVDAIHVNVTGTLKLCAASAEAGATHFVFISSIYSQMHPNSQYYSVYALSKRLAEEALSELCSRLQMNLTILRPAPLYGDHESFRRHQPFFYSLADKAEKGEEITLFGTHDAKRNFLHIDDLTRIIVEVIRLKITGTYSCQFPSDTSLSEIAQAAIDAFASSSQIKFLEDKDSVTDNIFPIDTSLYEKLNLYPVINVADGMKRLAAKRLHNT